MKRISKAELATNAQLEKLLPGSDCFDLPERVLQFGTGVLLRGLPDYFIDLANKQGIFNGRILVVKSTDIGGTDDFVEQDGMFLHVIRGISHAKPVDYLMLNASISRVLTAGKDWETILAAAANPLLDIIISNTTEVGLTLVEESIDAKPPVSFPGKLLAFLLRRYLVFAGDPSKGMVIIPTELIPDNGRLLKSICMELAVMNQLDAAFMQWLDQHCFFCDSLVDRIVPGKLPEAQQHALQIQVGATDQLSILSEPYALWAIEAAQPEVRQRLSFAAANPEVVLAPDINKFRQLKLHLLNGTHTFCCGVALLCEFNTVKEALDDKDFRCFIDQLIADEISPGIINDEILPDEAATFAASVLERFGNPFIQHYWQAIALNFSSKMRLRNLPVLLSYVERNGHAPSHMSFAFAAMLLYLHGKAEANGKFYGNLNGRMYPLQDDKVPLLNTCWVEGNLKETVSGLLAESSVWGMDLNKLSGFADAVEYWMRQWMTNEPRLVLAAMVNEKKTMTV